MSKNGIGGFFSAGVKHVNRVKNEDWAADCRFKVSCLRFSRQSYHCTHQGGVGCPTWREKTDAQVLGRFAYKAQAGEYEP